MARPDIVVIGGGLVGCAIAYGLARRGAQVLVLDGADRHFRASRANYGIVWVQGKGKGLPAYQAWTRMSSDAWPDFATDLQELTGVEICYERTGGLTFCLGDEEFENRRAEIDALRQEAGSDEYDTSVLDRRQVETLLGGVHLGSRVTGASYCWRDAHVNPLLLLQALQIAIRRLGGQIVWDTFKSAHKEGSTIVLMTGSARHYAATVVVAAGVDSAKVGRQFELDVPIRPQRGQILVTERVDPILRMPTVPIRQTAEGTLLIGSTQEEVGEDTSTTADAAVRMATRAVAILPMLERAVLVRQWSGLRIMSPDVAPIYAQAPSFPGVYVATCHSGVTLAAAHATFLAEAIAGRSLERMLPAFHLDRFNVPKAA